MAIRTIEVLKSYFKKGLYPTESNFEDLIDSTYGTGGGGADEKIKISATDNTEDYLNPKFAVGDEFTKEIVNKAENESLLLKFKGWIFNAARTFKAIFSSDSLTADRTITIPDISGLMAVYGMTNPFLFGGQVHGGNYIKTFTASAEFNANDGTNQVMTCTGDTTISMINALPGAYLIDLPISGNGVTTIAIDSSLGIPYPTNSDIAYTDGSHNTITVYVNPNGTKKYTINSIEA